MAVSIFNDVIGPVMRGPSSSHCAAALRIGRIARDLMDGDVAEVLVEFDRAGSLPTTHDSQGSDMGLFGGLLGWAADDERLPGALAAFQAAGGRAQFAVVDTHDPHPNTYRLTLKNAREQHTLIAVSTGGGMMEVIRIDDVPLRMDGGYHETLAWLSPGAACGLEGDEVIEHPIAGGRLVQVKAAGFAPDAQLAALKPLLVRRIHPVLPVASRCGMAVPFTTAAQLLAHDAGRNLPLWRHAVAYERARGALSDERVLAMMVELVRILRRSIEQGRAGTAYEDRVLGWQSGGFEQAMREGRLLDGGALNRAILYVTALMEVKSSMGVIIAMPTAGACAALPGVVIALAEERGLGEEDIARAFLAAGLVGVFIAAAWTFAAEEGGCQAEGGSASAMSAAALVTLAGGSLAQALAAASMALQSMIGLICDPIANRVEAPCLGKNVMAAANALSCANMALAGYDEVIPLDEVIETARRVAGQMPRELRCTALGGLSITPTSQRIEQRLAAHTCGGCGGSGCR